MTGTTLPVPLPPSAWIVVKEHAWHHGDGERPTLAYLWPSEFNQEVFPSLESARKFITDGGWPIGFVAMRLPLESYARACMAPLQERADALEAALREFLSFEDEEDTVSRYSYKWSEALKAARSLINPTGGESS